MYAIILVFTSLHILTEPVRDEVSMSVLWSDTYAVDADSILSPLVFARASADSIARTRTHASAAASLHSLTISWATPSIIPLPDKPTAIPGVPRGATESTT